MATSGDDRRLLLLCEQARQQSHDPDRKVGAVIADPEGRTLAIGTNAPPEPLKLSVSDSHRAIERDPSWKYFTLEHAERNAIFAAYRSGKALDGATMYSTLFPCADCARAIVASGIKRLVVLGLGSDPVRDTKWAEHYRHAQRILELAGIAIRLVDPREFEAPDGAH